MINVEFLFKDAIESLAYYGEHISVNALPSTVFLMQQDVLNNIEYCSKHALAGMLDEAFVRKLASKSQLKNWVREFNVQASALFASLRNLVCYTNRLLHDSKLKKYNKDNLYDEYMRIRNEYICIMTDLSYQEALLGVFATEEKALIVFSIGGAKEFDPHAHYQRLARRDIPVDDTSAVTELFDGLAKEAQTLIPLSEQYGELCKRFNSSNEIISPIFEMSNTWWI